MKFHKGYLPTKDKRPKGKYKDKQQFIDYEYARAEAQLYIPHKSWGVKFFKIIFSQNTTGLPQADLL